MSERNDGGPAFPQMRAIVDGACARQVSEGGLTLRDYFAAKAMAGMVGGTWPDLNERPEIAKRAYLMADAMLKARTA